LPIASADHVDHTISARKLAKTFVDKNYKKYDLGPTRIRTGVGGFKVLSDNHYTIGPTADEHVCLVGLYIYKFIQNYLV
jgi:hypothetical protein